MASGLAAVRAIFQDALDDLRHDDEHPDPAPSEARDGVAPGQWPGAPADRLPPDCPVIPLGVAGKSAFFIDTSQQLIEVEAKEWGKKMLVQMFALTPNYLYWAWPRYGKPRSDGSFHINGLEADDAHQCLVKAAAQRGQFTAADRVRGRGAWKTRDGRLLWHAGDRIFRIDSGRLKAAKPGAVDGMFYPRMPSLPAPWREAVKPQESPAHAVLAALRSWNWGRPQLDPVLVLGWMGCAMLGAALVWRPHLFLTGDKHVGKSTLNRLFKDVFGDILLDCAETTAAGIYQTVRDDCLPVAIDEFEASGDNRKASAVLTLARLAASGTNMRRGGSDHRGVTFQSRNAFMMAAINMPPMEPAEKSRFIVGRLGRFSESAEPPKIADITGEACGRQILRCLMDQWPQSERLLRDWRESLRQGGLNARHQDTYGTALAVAQMMIGAEAMEAAGLPIDDQRARGAAVARWTDDDRSAEGENWSDCLERLLGSTIEAWRGGEKPSVGQVLEEWEAKELTTSEANKRLALVGLACRREDRNGRPVRDGEPGATALLAVPVKSTPALARLMQGSKWSDGGWAGALQQGPAEVVIRNRGGRQNVKINRVTMRCALVDLAVYDSWAAKERGDNDTDNDDAA